jgi:hypothetical protein
LDQLLDGLALVHLINMTVMQKINDLSNFADYREYCRKLSYFFCLFSAPF